MCQITKAQYEGGYRIRFSFDDGTERLADFGPFLEASSHPLVRKFLDTELFSQFRIEHWGLTVAWGDNEFDLSADDIHRGDFDAYDPEMVAKVKRSRKSKGCKIASEDIWK